MRKERRIALLYTVLERDILRYIYSSKTDELAVERMKQIAKVADPTGYLSSRLNRRYLGLPEQLIVLFRHMSLKDKVGGWLK